MLNGALVYKKTIRLHPKYDGTTKFARLFAEDGTTRLAQEYNLFWVEDLSFYKVLSPSATGPYVDLKSPRI
jgi:hypothetical protein